MVTTKRPITIEYRSKKKAEPLHDVPSSQQAITWLRASVFPELDENGAIQTVHGWTEDISLQKFTAELLETRLHEAIENRRQSENLIDIVSHEVCHFIFWRYKLTFDEVRNPLSAILQCAESIIIACSSMETHKQWFEGSVEILSVL